MDNESLAQVMEEATLTKIRLKLNEQKVKLWEPPYYDSDKMQPNEASLHELAVSLRSELDLAVGHLFQGVQILQQTALEKLSAKKKFTSCGELELRLRCAKGLQARSKKIELPVTATGAQLLHKVGELVGRSPSVLKLICGGKVVQDTLTLQDQGVKTSSVLMAVLLSDREMVNIVEEQRRILQQTKADAERLGTRNATTDDYYLQVADQSGRPLTLPSEERKALIIAMSLHEKGRAALKREDFALALVLLLEAESEFSFCRSELVDRIDNIAILSMDIAWCYLMLQSVSELPNAEERLLSCEKKFKESYGSNMERLDLLKGGSGKEQALLVRLHLLQGIVAFHLGRDRQAALLLEKAAVQAKLMAVNEEQLALLVQLGYSVSEARLGLRGSQNDVQLAVESIERMRTERSQIREKEKEERDREALRRELGKCADGSWVNLGYYNTLLSMGFSKKVSCAALKQANNSLNTAVQLLQEEPELIQLAVQEAGSVVEEEEEEDVARLVSLGYKESMARAALQSENSLEKAADVLAANNGRVERKDGVERKRLKQDKEAYERIKEDIVDAEEDHLDLDLRIENDFLEKYLQLLKK